MSNSHGYETPRIETLQASEILERLGPVSAGSGSTDSSKKDCTIADYLLGNC